MELDNPFSVGDVVMCSDKTSPFYRRDSIVVFNDFSVFAVMSEGVDFVSFFSVMDTTFTLIKKGEGKSYLTTAQKAMLDEILRHWTPIQLLKAFPEVLKQQREQITEKDEQLVPLHITAYVPETMARIFREFAALIEMSKSVNPGFDKDPHQMIMEWAILSITNIMPVLLAKQVKDNFEHKEGGEG